MWKSRGCQSWSCSLLWLRIRTDPKAQWNLLCHPQPRPGWRFGPSQRSKIPPPQWKKTWRRVYPVCRWRDARPRIRHFYSGKFKIKYAWTMCGKTRVSCRVRIPKEDQEHGKSTSRSQLHICPSCGLLLWSLASCCCNSDQEIDKGKVHKTGIGWGKNHCCRVQDPLCLPPAGQWEDPH